MHLQKFSFSRSKFPWIEIFQKLYGINDLEMIHTLLPSYKSYKPINDSSSLLHKIFYSNFQELFGDMYLAFIRSLVNVFHEDFYYQEIPCVRFGPPNYSWLTEFHRDSDYAHPKQEININLAITRSLGSAALQIEDLPGSGRYVPLEQSYGDFTIIDHIGCRHGTAINTEDYTLISLDFRLVPVSLAEEAFSDRASLLVGKRFRPGEYFSATPISKHFANEQ